MNQQSKKKGIPNITNLTKQCRLSVALILNRDIMQTSLPIIWMVSTEVINMSAQRWADKRCLLQ